jgi:N,N'-diacetyllegionaminate synthase
MGAPHITIGHHTIGPDYPPFIIAEIAQAHDGSLGMAHAYIDAVADTGVQAIKFQTHLAQYESTLDEEFRIQFSYQDKTRFDYWKRMEFTEQQWRGLAIHAQKRGLVFLSSAFSVQAVEMLKKIGMPAWKVGSGELYFKELLQSMGENGAPLIISTGMASYSELDEIVRWAESCRLAYALLQCTSKYPVSLEEVGLNVMAELRNRYACPTGLSDHSGSIYPGLAAMALNADLLEVHVTFDRRMFGPDISASVTLKELSLLVEARNAFRVMLQHPVDKDAVAVELYPLRLLFCKSVAPLMPLKAGTIMEEHLLTAKKPGTGIDYSERHKLIGRRLRRDVSPERILHWEDFDES